MAAVTHLEKICYNLSVIASKVVIIGVWPSGKAHGFGPCIRGFESLHPSQVQHLR